MAPAAELAVQEEPEEPDDIPENLQDLPAPDPFDPVRTLLFAIDGQDVDAIVDTFHPLLQDEVRDELREEDSQLPQVRECLQRTLEINRAEPVTELPHRLSNRGELGDRLTGLDSGNGNQTLVILHDDRYVLLDTGC